MRKVLLLIVAFITLLKATSLDEMYNNANPGEGYDKLIILEKIVSIVAGLFKMSNLFVFMGTVPRLF